MTLPISTVKREQGCDRKIAIALAARALIAEKGLEGLRTRDIALRVGINIATLHYHVPSKEALIALVAESIRNEFRQQAQERPRDSQTGLERLRMEFEDFRAIVAGSPDLINVLTELVERGRRDPLIGDIINPLHDFWTAQFATIFRLGMADGSFRTDIDPDAAAILATGTCSQYWRDRSRLSADLDAIFSELERAFALNPSPRE